MRRRPRRVHGSGLYYGWVLVIVLGVTQTITWGILYYGFSVFLPALEADLGWSRGAMSGAFSVALLLAGLAAAPVGRWLDARGPRLLMTGGSVVASALLLALSRVTDLAQFYVVWALIGLSMAAVLYEPAFAVVTAWFERQRTRALSAVTLVAGFASTIFMPLEAWLIEVQGWRGALATLAALLACTTILPHALLLRRRPEDMGLHVDGDRASHPPRPGSEPPAAVSVAGAVRDPTFRGLTVAFGLTTIASIAVHVHLVAYLQDRGFDPALAAAAAGLVGATQVAGRILLGVLGDRVPLRLSTAVVLGTQPVALLVLLLTPAGIGVFAFIALFGAAKGAVTLIRPAYVALLFGRERYASIAGAMAAFILPATALAPVTAGAARDALGSYEPLFWGFVALSAVAAAVAMRVQRRPGPGPVTDASPDDLVPQGLARP